MDGAPGRAVALRVAEAAARRSRHPGDRPRGGIHGGRGRGRGRGRLADDSPGRHPLADRDGRAGRLFDAPGPLRGTGRMIGWQAVASALVLGLVAGVLSGMFGIGGGLVIVPTLVIVYHEEIKTATGTSLFALMWPVGLLGVIEYWRRGELRP